MFILNIKNLLVLSLLPVLLAQNDGGNSKNGISQSENSKIENKQNENSSAENRKTIQKTTETAIYDIAGANIDPTVNSIVDQNIPVDYDSIDFDSPDFDPANYPDLYANYDPANYDSTDSELPTFNVTTDDYISSQARCENLLETFECIKSAKNYDLKKQEFLENGKAKEWFGLYPDDCYRPQWTMFACWKVDENTEYLFDDVSGNKIYQVNISWPKIAPKECYHVSGSWRRDCEVMDFKNKSETGMDSIEITFLDPIIEWKHDMHTILQHCPVTPVKELYDTETNAIHKVQELWFNFDRVLRIIQTVLTFSAFGLMLFLKRIHCTRIYIHMHLLLSFILRSILFSLYQSDINPDIVRRRAHRSQAEVLHGISSNDTMSMMYHPFVQKHTELLHHGIWQSHQEDLNITGNNFLHTEGVWNEPNITNVHHLLTNHCSQINAYQTTFIPCKIVAVLLQYFVTTNYCWLLVEGIYLSLLLQTSSVTSKFTITPFAILGWGVPWLSIIVWTCVMWLTDPDKIVLNEDMNSETNMYKMGSCWLHQAGSSFVHQRKFQWLIQIPIFITLGLNVYIFTSVVSVVNIKLRASNTDYKIRLARSTLSLIPLLGIQYGFTVWMEDLSWEDSEIGTEWLLVQFFMQTIFNRMPGILVALIYCFFNSEVQTEFLTRLRAFNLGREVEMDAYRRRSTISNSNISNQIGGPKTSLSEMSNSMIPPPGNNHGYHHGGQHGGHSDRHTHDLQRRKSSIFVDTSMWFKSYFVKPRGNENRFAMQRRASALNQNNMSVGQLSSSKHSLNGGTLTRGNNSINSNVFSSNAVGSNVANNGTLITSNNVLDQYNVQASCPKSGMNRLHSTSSPS